jgi:hypothetical protein
MKPRIYLFLNFTIAGIILVVFLYSIIYSSSKDFHPVKCFHEELLGARCPICGMSSGFSAILKGQFKEAFIIQPNSMRIFLFLFVLLLMKITAILLLLKAHVSCKVISTTDIILTVVLFILTFKSIIPQVFYIYYKMLITGSTAY